MKTLIAVLIGLAPLQLFGAAGGPSVVSVTETNYVSHRIAYVHRYEGEPYPAETLGYVETKWDTTDLLMQGGWDPDSIGMWAIETDRWQVTLELSEPPWRTIETIHPSIPEPEETFYGFHLTLAKTDGSWSHTFEHLGGWSERQAQQVFVPYGDVLLGPDSTIGQPLLTEADSLDPMRLTHITLPDRIPFNVQNGGTTDTGYDQHHLLYNYQWTLEDIPVGEDEWIAFSLGIGWTELGYEQGDLFARIGIGEEFSRISVEHIPEPGVLQMVGIGLILMVMVLLLRRR